jgi:mono/diheme cytochrome c family protein
VKKCILTVYLFLLIDSFQIDPMHVLWFLFSCATLSIYEAQKPSVPPPMPELSDDASETEIRGWALYRTAGCIGCHSPPFPNAKHLGGDRDLPTIFGRFYAPNISPDEEDGIGSWSEEDFHKAMQKGISPENKRYWPTFPYMAYTKMQEEDLHALWVYLNSQEPVKGREREKELNPNYRMPGLIRIWRLLEFQRGTFKEDPNVSDEINRGRYLVQAVGYCDQCHTPRNRLGKLVDKYYMAGGSNLGKSEIHPNLTPHMERGIGKWTTEDIVEFLTSGQKPDGTEADHHQVMAEKIEDSYSYFSTQDKKAIAAYLKSLPPKDFDPSTYQP